MRRSIYNRDLLGPFGKLKLEEITPAALMALCEKVKARGAPAPAVQVREIVLLVFRFAHTKDKTLDLKNPAESIRPSDIATFKARERALSPVEIKQFFLANCVKPHRVAALALVAGHRHGAGHSKRNLPQRLSSD